MKPLILSEEHKQQLANWFGPDPKDWVGKQVILYHKVLRDENGKKLGDTIGMCLPTEEPDHIQ
jgi:hypothetical protein